MTQAEIYPFIMSFTLYPMGQRQGIHHGQVTRTEMDQNKKKKERERLGTQGIKLSNRAESILTLLAKNSSKYHLHLGLNRSILLRYYRAQKAAPPQLRIFPSQRSFNHCADFKKKKSDKMFYILLRLCFSCIKGSWETCWSNIPQRNAFYLHEVRPRRTLIDSGERHISTSPFY